MALFKLHSFAKEPWGSGALRPGGHFGPCLSALRACVYSFYTLSVCFKGLCVSILDPVCLLWNHGVCCPCSLSVPAQIRLLTQDTHRNILETGIWTAPPSTFHSCARSPTTQNPPVFKDHHSKLPRMKSVVRLLWVIGSIQAPVWPDAILCLACGHLAG